MKISRKMKSAMMALPAMAVLASLGLGAARAETLVVGPLGTASGGNGTAAAPFSSLGAAFASGRVDGGDTLLLMPGSYGDVVIKGVAPTSPVVIRSAQGRTAIFDRISVEWRSANLTFDRISVVWSRPPSRWNSLFSTTGDTSGITIQNSTIKGHPDSSNFRRWTAQEWLDRSATGVNLNGRNGKALRNAITGIGFGIQVNGLDHLIEGNTVNGYSADGLRGNGNRLVFRGNRVTNCVSVDGNHADGFQSFNLARDGSTFDGIVLEGNIFIEQTFQPRLPLACGLQGIGMFDGMFSNLRIVNNRVEVSAYHGIAVSGAVNALIDGNVVVQAPGGANKPWIFVGNHKDGRQSSGVVISNNVSASRVIGPFAPGVNNTIAP